MLKNPTVACCVRAASGHNSRASVLGPISQFLAREGLLPIDAKFPHDSFERVVAAGGPEIRLRDFLPAPKSEGGQNV
jgi:hypothetical protein